ncbi:unnamed protein product [Symbiodinium sp. CCMP2592]|nr:unnamed protein product [Symbiodinium sp. CCMP2592]
MRKHALGTCLLTSVFLLARTQPPCTWHATEPCYLQLGSIFEYRHRDSNRDGFLSDALEHDCDGRRLQPYLDAVNRLNGGKGFMVHSAGLEIAQSTPYEKYYYQLNYTRLAFDNWTHGEALSRQHFPSWSYIAGMGNGCPDALIVEQAKIANATERIWMTPRGPWSQMSQAAGSLPWAFSSHLDSSDYAKVSAQQFALKGAKTAALLSYCCDNKFLDGVRMGTKKHLENAGIVIKLHDSIRTETAASDIERAVERLVAMKVDVVFTAVRGADLGPFIASLEKHRELQVPDGLFAVNLPWPREGALCFSYGERCKHLVTGAQTIAFPNITDSLRDGVLGLTGAEYSNLPGVPGDYNFEVGLSAFLQAVQAVFQYREVKDPTNLLHSVADPDVYTAVRKLILSGEDFGQTFGGPASFSPLGQINGMDPPTATLTGPVDLPVLFPTEFAQAPFEFPVPAARSCAPNFYKVFQNQSSCPLCAADCIPCPPHSQRLDPVAKCSCKELYYESNSSECKLCPEGVICPGASVLENLNLSRGFWRAGRFVEEILPCSVDACTGGNVVGDEGCEEGHMGPLCSVCWPEHFYDLNTKKCSPCSSNGAFWGPQQWLVSFLALFLVAWVCLRQGIKRALTRMVGKGNAHAKLKEINTKLKIVVSLLQVLNTIPGVFRFVTWPAALLQFMEVLSMFNLSIFQVVPADCVHPNTFYDRLLVTTLLPISLWVILALICQLRVCWLKAQSQQRAEIQSGFFGVALMVAYLVLPAASSTIFDTFKCQSFDLDDGQVGRFLQADLAINCDTDIHQHYIVYAACMTAVYPAGIPIWMAITLWRHRKAINPEVSQEEIWKAQEILESSLKGGFLQSSLSRTASKISRIASNLSRSFSRSSNVSTSLQSKESSRYKAGPKECRELATIMKRDNDPTIKHLLFIFDDYKPSCMYFEVFESLRKIFLSGALAFIASGSWLQVVVGLFACQLSLKVLQRFQPYANPTATTTAEIAQQMLFTNLVFGLLILSSESEDPEVLGWDFGPSSLMTSLGSVAVIAGSLGLIVFTLLFSLTEWETLQKPLEEPGSGEGKDALADEELDEWVEAAF